MGSGYSRRAIFPTIPNRLVGLWRWLVMTANQIAIPESDDEILTQAQAYKFMGVTRSAFRGFLERKELPIADELGVKGAARVRRSDVLRLMEKRGMKPKTIMPVQTGQTACPGCEALREQVRRLRDDRDRMERALNAAVRST